jgi:hypothetical protein
MPYAQWRNIAWKLPSDDAERVMNTFIVGGPHAVNAQFVRVT